MLKFWIKENIMVSNRYINFDIFRKNTCTEEKNNYKFD